MHLANLYLHKNIKKFNNFEDNKDDNIHKNPSTQIIDRQTIKLRFRSLDGFRLFFCPFLPLLIHSPQMLLSIRTKCHNRACSIEKFSSLFLSFQFEKLIISAATLYLISKYIAFFTSLHHPLSQGMHLGTHTLTYKHSHTHKHTHAVQHFTQNMLFINLDILYNNLLFFFI